MIKETKYITESEMIQLMSQVDKPTFINLSTEIVQDMKKTGNPYFGKVLKTTKTNYLVGGEYEKRVNNNDKKEGGEGTFESSYNRVGQHQSKSVLFNPNMNGGQGEWYLQVEFFPENKPKVEYFFEGNTIEKSLFQSFLHKVSENKSQPQERKVQVRSFKFKSIKEMTYEGVRYVKV